MWVVPVFDHAFQKALSPFEVRLAMCRGAFGSDARVRVSDLESRLSRPSFTLNTLQAVRAERPGEELRLIVGADVIAETSNWHRFDEVQALARPLVLGRAGVPSTQAPPAVLPEVSSTDIRAWFSKSGKEEEELLRRMVPREVRTIAERERLYR